MVVYKRFPHKSLCMAVVMLIFNVWHGVHKAILLVASFENYVLIFLPLPSDGGVQEDPLQVSLPLTAAVMLMSSVWHGVYSQ